MTKQDLWTQVYLESLKKDFSTVKAETAATQALKSFERAFPPATIPKGAKNITFTRLEHCGCDQCDKVD